jgi:hypothetical protein
MGPEVQNSGGSKTVSFAEACSATAEISNRPERAGERGGMAMPRNKEQRAVMLKLESFEVL